LPWDGIVAPSSDTGAFSEPEPELLETFSNGTHLFKRARGRVPKKPTLQYLQTVFYASPADPFGETSIYDIDTAPGSIMRHPIPYLSGEMRLPNGELAGEVGPPTRVTRTRVSRTTRTRVSKLPFGQTGTQAVPTITTTLDTWNRCGAVIGLRCPEGLCCSVYGFCGGSDAQ